MLPESLAFGVVRGQTDMALFGGIQRALPAGSDSRIRTRAQPWRLIVTNPKGKSGRPAVSQAGVRTGDAEGVSHIEFGNWWRYAKRSVRWVLTAGV